MLFIEEMKAELNTQTDSNKAKLNGYHPLRSTV